MDRSVLVRKATPFAVFVAVLALLVTALSLRGGDHSPRLLPLGAAAANREQSKTSGGQDAAAPAIAPYYGDVVIPDSLLPGLPTEGPAYALDAAVTKERVAALAGALGIDGEPRQDEQGWVVGTGDRALRVLKTAGAAWYVGPDKVAVMESRGGVPDGSVSSGGGSTGVATGVATAAPVTAGPASEPADAPPPCPTPPGMDVVCAEPGPVPVETVSPPPQPSDDAARSAAAKVFAAVGLGGAPVVVTPGWGTKEVAAAPVVGGLPTVGYETRVAVDAAGQVTYASGLLGTPSLEDSYPLLGPREAVERGGGTYAARDLMMGAPCEPGATCPRASTPPDRVATGVRLGLLLWSGYDGTTFLAPAWLLAFADTTYEEPVLALPDRYIATPPPATTEPGSVEPGSADPDQPVCNPDPCPKPNVTEVPPAPPESGNG